MSSSDSEVHSDEDMEHQQDLQALVRRGLNAGEKLLDDAKEEKPEVPHEKKHGIYQADALKQKLDDISYPVPAGYKRVPWIETLVVETARDQSVTASKDVKRESNFHDCALEAVREAYRRFHVMGVPASRPNDFYATMLKNDSQMFKVRSKIAYEQKAIDVVENRKKIQAEKKFGKQVQKSRLAEKALQKKAAKDQIKNWQSKGADNADGDDVEFDASGKGKTIKGSKKATKSKKREGKDKKYGSGGKRDKRNTKESSSEKATFAKKKTKGAGKGKGGGKGKRGKK